MVNSKFKTPIEEIFFRSSKIGLLAGGIDRHELTKNQRAEMEKLELQQITPEGISEKQQEWMDEMEIQRTTPEGISEKQQIELEVWESLIEEGKELPLSKIKKLEEYKRRIEAPKPFTVAQKKQIKKLELQKITPKPLTETQLEKLKKLKELEARPPELSKGAKSYVKELWRENEKGFKEEITTKKLRKGKQAEEDAITLISIVDKVCYHKNEERKYVNNTTGECDVIHYFDELQINHNPERGVMFVGAPKVGVINLSDKKVIDDTKCSWNPRTFMNSELTSIYEWQGRSYLYQYDADIFRLRHCLVDCPPDVLQEEYYKFRCIQKLRRSDLEHLVDNELIEQIDQGQVSEDYPEYKEMIDQFFNNFLYESTGYYTPDERVKTFIIERNEELEETLKLAVKLGIEYYQTITLNMID